jgi:hypothetical protein
MTHARLSLLLLLVAVAPTRAAAEDAVSAVLGGTGRFVIAQVAAQGVLDDAHLFSPEAIAAAQDKVRQLRREYRCAVFIDTVSGVPAADYKRAHSWNSKTADAYFHEWALSRSQEFGVEGIHVLICTEPRHIEVLVWPESYDAEFGPKERLGLQRMLTRQLKTKPDAALLQALEQIHVALRARYEPAAPSVDLMAVGAVLLAGVGAWLVLALVRWYLRKPEPFSFTGEMQTVAPTARLLAGMFGTPAAYWVMDRELPQTDFVKVEPIAFVEEPPDDKHDAPPVEDAMPEHAAINDD